MRKIEQQMNRAIRNMIKAKQVDSWKQDNTKVDSDRTGSIWVYLYGHNVAFYDARKDERKIDLCGYNTVTTRSRLTSILTEFAVTRGVGTRKGQAFISHYDGTDQLINDSGWHVVR